MFSSAMQLNDITNSSTDNGKSKTYTQKRDIFLDRMLWSGMLRNVLIDTGANECLIRKDIVRDMSNIKPSNITITVKLFDGSEVNILGYFYFSPNNIKGKSKKMRFYVVAELPYPIILGANWIQWSGATFTHDNYCLLDGVEVGGIGPIDVMVDSGCSSCVVKLDVLTDSIKSTMVPGADKSATLFNGSELDLLGFVNLQVSYLGKTVELPFYVVAEFSPPIILGTPWIRRNGAIIHSDGRKIGVTLGGEEEIEGSRADKCALPYVPVDVKGIGMVKALVDTGSSSCYIRRDILTKLKKLKIVSTSYRKFSVLNTAQRKEREYVSLSITFQGITTCIKNVHVESKMANELVLGMDWIHQTRSVILSDGLETIVSHSDLPSKKKRSKRLVAYFSKQWKSTIGSIRKMPFLVSNLM